MQREPIPPPGKFDPLTRMDELLTHNIATLAEVRDVLKTITTRPHITPELKNLLEAKQIVPYEVKTFALDTARADEEVIVQGHFLLAETNGVKDGCFIRLNHATNDQVPLKFFSPLILPFSRIYLTTTAQAGKTLYIFLGGEATAEAATSSVIVSTSQQFNLVRTDKDTHFTGALVQYAKEDENLTGLLANKGRITGITLQADQRLHYKLLVWYKDGFDDTDLDLDMFCGEIDVDLSIYGIQIAGANQWYLDIRGLHLDYDDLDESKELHISLFNSDPTAKAAGATGEVVVVITYEPRS